jgi:hypothetical protein
MDALYISLIVTIVVLGCDGGRRLANGKCTDSPLSYIILFDSTICEMIRYDNMI